MSTPTKNRQPFAGGGAAGRPVARAAADAGQAIARRTAGSEVRVNACLTAEHLHPR